MFCSKQLRYLIPVFALSTTAVFADSHSDCDCMAWHQHEQQDHQATNMAGMHNGAGACNLDFALVLHLASKHGQQYPELQKLLPCIKNVDIDALCKKIDCGACYNAHMQMYHSQGK